MVGLKNVVVIKEAEREKDRFMIRLVLVGVAFSRSGRRYLDTYSGRLPDGLTFKNTTTEYQYLVVKC